VQTPHSLIQRLKYDLRQRVVVSLVLIVTLGVGLHVIWSLYERNQAIFRIRNALNHVLQEPLMAKDLPGVRRSIQAFSLSNPGAQICIKVEDELLIEYPACDNPMYVEYPLGLTPRKVSISVSLPRVTWMVLVGLPVLLTALGVAFLLAAQIKKLAALIVADLANLLNLQSDVSFHFSEMLEAKRSVCRGFAAERQAEKVKADARVGSVAAQVAHDIRSPLAALQVALRDVDAIAPDQRELIEQASGRIRDIANSLIRLYQKNEPRPLWQVTWVSKVLDDICSEKRLQYLDFPKLRLSLAVDPSALSACVGIDKVELSRLISNLLNNSIEALPSHEGEISIGVTAGAELVCLLIKDSGRGIPPEVLNRITERGFSFNKFGGSGLGLSTAIETIERAGGSLTIMSEPGQGTSIAINLPAVLPPAPLCVQLEVGRDDRFAILDDDLSVHQAWKLAFGEPEFRRRVDSFTDVHEFQEVFNRDIKSWKKCLIDFDLNSELSGLQLIEKLNIQSISILVTSRYEDSAVLEKCRELQVPLLPKFLIGTFIYKDFT